jgi:nucleolar protein 12
MVALDLGLEPGADKTLPSIQDFFGSAAHTWTSEPPTTSARAPKKANDSGSHTPEKKRSKKEKRVSIGGTESRELQGDGSLLGKKRQQREASAEDDGSEAGEGGDSSVQGDNKLERTIFVGGVPLAEEGRLINPKTIKAFFRDCGEIESVRLRSLPVDNPVLPKKAAIAMGKINAKRETCNAYVVFKTVESVAAALKKDGSAFDEDGHLIRVDAAKPPGEGIQVQNVRLSVFVGNVPFNAEEDALRGHFGHCGEITNVRIVRDPATAAGKGFAFVSFTDCDAVSDAMQLNGSKMKGSKRELRVTRCKGAKWAGAGAADKDRSKKVSNRMGVEFRRRKERQEKRAQRGAGGGAEKHKSGKGLSHQDKLKNKEKYLKIDKAPKFKKRNKDKGVQGTRGSKAMKRKAKDKKALKKASKKANKTKTRKV